MYIYIILTMHYLYHTFIYALLVLFLFKIKNNTLYYILFEVPFFKDINN